MANLLSLLRHTGGRAAVASLVRHALTALGVYLISRGYTDDAGWSAVVVDLTPIVVAVLWSLVDKAGGNRERAALRLAVAFQLAIERERDDLAREIAHGDDAA